VTSPISRQELSSAASARALARCGCGTLALFQLACADTIADVAARTAAHIIIIIGDIIIGDIGDAMPFRI
jgi:hypothetical protein